MTSPRVKLQTSIPNSNIVIDYWDVKTRNGHDPSIRFMASIKNLSVKAVAQMRKANYRMYTSMFNKWFLHQFYEISEDRIMVLDHNETMEIFDSDKKEKFKVTSIDANYCSGSSMFLFEGSFGNILYTGFFRLSPSLNVLGCSELKEVVEKNTLHLAYVDNSFAAENCHFPSRKETIAKTIELIRNSNCKIMISSNQWGKEEVLIAIAAKLDEKIDVGPQRYSIFERLGIAESFTCQSKETRITALDHLLSFHECQKILKQDKSCVIILMTAIYMCGPKKIPSKFKNPRLYIMPHSGHCNHAELKEFVRIIRPHAILPVMQPNTYQACSVIPQSIYDLCGQVDDSSPSVNDGGQVDESSPTVNEDSGQVNSTSPSVNEDGRINWANCNPLVVIPRLQVSPLRLKRVNGSYCTSSSTTPVQRSPVVQRKSPRLPVVAHACDCTNEKANASLPTRRSARLSSASTSATEKEKSLQKSTSNAPSPQSVPASSNASLRSNVSATEQESRHKKPINVSVIRCFSSDSHSPVPPSSSSKPRPVSANVSPRDQRVEKSTSNTHPAQPIEHVTVLESVRSLCRNAECPARYSRDENEQCFVRSLNNLIIGAAESDPLSQNETNALDMPELDMPMLDMPVLDMPVLDMPELDMPKLDYANPPTTSSPNNCFIREESCDVLLDSASSSVDRSAENVDETPLTLQLQNADIRFIREDCRNVLLGSTFPRIGRDEPVEEVSASDLASKDSLFANDLVIEEYIVEETILSSSDVHSDRETLSSSKNSNKERVEAADSSQPMDVDGETASMCEIVSDTSAIGSTMQSLTSVTVEEDSCVLVESSGCLSDSSHSLVRASPNGRPRDGDQSDSDDCVVVREYMRGSETPAPIHRPSKRLKLDLAYRPRRNSRFVNAIIFHHMKAFPQEIGKLRIDQWNFLSKCNIFSHPCYRA